MVKNIFSCLIARRFFCVFFFFFWINPDKQTYFCLNTISESSQTHPTPGNIAICNKLAEIF